MPDTLDALKCYRDHYQLTEKMRKYAVEENWDSLLTLHEKYEILSHALMQLPLSSGGISSESNYDECRVLQVQIEENHRFLEQAMRKRQYDLTQLIHETVNQQGQIKSYSEVANLI